MYVEVKESLVPSCINIIKNTDIIAIIPKRKLSGYLYSGFYKIIGIKFKTQSRSMAASSLNCPRPVEHIYLERMYKT